MTMAVLNWSLTISQILVSLALICAAFRMLRGPRAQDRVLGLDAAYLNGMLLLLLFGIRSGDTVYFEAALIIAVLGFIGTAALAKFLMRGEVIE
ncbi:MAG: K+/H+ antiporter subunit F [Parvibaculum sp.]|uniref:K+/H+ antiporter subunit F n=1 Tax=Parvibaculum sp. TaxID=2024848 RepID=UPI003C74068A